ncbi:MAG TPA: 30S ribosomal protein S8 [Candidatus Sulfotelmatobacter sp.]|jgi:small subunit ribosomal protein S8|nr:30S ribosomal protein S8 [Candidatus Sulfotelmatobacter sp.]
MNYVIGDFVIQLKNAALAHRKAVVAPYANISKAVAKVLKKEGFVDAISEETIDGKRMLSVALRYQRRKPAITDINLISKPSLRTYIAAHEIARKQGRAATAILSTNVGILTGNDAIKKGVGGELLFKIW